MSVYLPVALHALGNVRIQLPKESLAQYFRKVGVELVFSDSANDQRRDFFASADPDLIAREIQSDVDASSDGIQIYFASKFSIGAENLNGMVAHPFRRAAAIFVEGPAFQDLNSQSDPWLEVIAHELGHLFTLDHEQRSSEPFPTVMLCGKQRSRENIKRAWDFATSQTQSYKQDNLNCLPFSSADYNLLRLYANQLSPNNSSSEFHKFWNDLRAAYEKLDD